MKDRISALMDGELDDSSAADAIAELAREGEARQAWRAYHLIGDAMRDTRLPLEGFQGRLHAEPSRWFPMAAAASAAIALVGWVAFAPQPQTVPAPAPVAQVKPVPIPAAANDYLFAHQGFSPRVSLQGMAPYVRTVSDEASRK